MIGIHCKSDAMKHHLHRTRKFSTGTPDIQSPIQGVVAKTA